MRSKRHKSTSIFLSEVPLRKIRSLAQLRGKPHGIQPLLRHRSDAMKTQKFSRHSSLDEVNMGTVMKNEYTESAWISREQDGYLKPK